MAKSDKQQVDRQVSNLPLSLLRAVYWPSLPLKQAVIAKEVGYDPEKFTTKSLVGLLGARNYSWKQQTRYGKFLALTGYYIWIFYIGAALWIITLSPLAGVIAIAMSPLLVLAVMYMFVSLIWNLKYRRIAKKAMKQTDVKTSSSLDKHKHK